MFEDQPGSEMQNVQVQLGANLECELIDEFNFQVQTAILSDKVLKLLEDEDAFVHTKSAKFRHYSKSTLNSASSSIVHNAAGGSLFPTIARTRSSSWISAQSLRTSVYSRSPIASFAESALLDKILDSNPSCPPTGEIIRMMNLLTSVHAYCPNQSSVGGVMGATCTLASDYCSVVSTGEAMTKLVLSIRALLETRAPTALISATVPVNGRLVVCGDTHGQLEDLIWIFFKNGLPSPTNVYIFNGDIADRGGHALEIFLLLFLFKLNCYDSVHIIRGNHEDDYCNIYYGFLAELKHKFGPIAGGAIHYEFLQLFYALPLACLVDSWVGSYKCNVTGAIIDLSLSDNSAESPSSKPRVSLRRKDAHSGHGATIVSVSELTFEKRVAVRGLGSDCQNVLTWGGGDTWEYIDPRLLVLHGGIPVPVSQSSLASSAVLLKSFHDLPHKMKIPPAPKTVLEQWMYQILWSDPQEVDGPKGRGTAFFHAHTKAFAEANNLSAVIRAHQVPFNQRGVSFHHKQRMVTIFSASNYCGSSQNYGGVAIFTPQWFPKLVINQTLFEHWAPPLSVTKELLSKHQNATQDVRLFIAHEIESERAPYDRMNAGMLTHLEEKVAEYVCSLIVEHKTRLWSEFSSTDEKFVTVSVWERICGQIIGEHFPWHALLVQLEVGLVEGKVDWRSFLDRFRAGCKFGEPLVDTWESSVVWGFFHEIVLQAANIVEDLLNDANEAKLKEILTRRCPNLTETHIDLFCQALSYGEEDARATFLATMSEYYRALFSLMDAAPDSILSEETVQVGRDSLEIFPRIRAATNPEELYRDLCGGLGNCDTKLFADRLELRLAELGLGEFCGGRARACIEFVSGEGSTDISLVQFYGSCFMDGTPVGERAKQRIAEHATASLYFHRNALRCACVHLDKKRMCQIDRRSFQRAFHALNASVEPEWRLSTHQQRCVIEYMRWQDQDDEQSSDHLVIEYDLFLEYVSLCWCVYYFLVPLRSLIAKE